ncbi:MAG: response regulator transcription factor [Bryobacteraceae bacterium]
MWILVVEDEPSMAHLLRQGLEEQNHTVVVARDGEEAMAAATNSPFDAVVLDVMIPHVDGIEVARRLRAAKIAVPILMLTARDANNDVVKGLDAGADDYLVKPFAFSVLLARLRAISRRRDHVTKQVLETDDLTLDPTAHRVFRAGHEIALTATEFRILEFLMRNSDRAESRSAIIEAVWGFDEDVELNTVDVYIKILRDKLDTHPHRKLIHTVRGYGYVIRA